MFKHCGTVFIDNHPYDQITTPGIRHENRRKSMPEASLEVVAEGLDDLVAPNESVSVCPEQRAREEVLEIVNLDLFCPLLQLGQLDLHL